MTDEKPREFTIDQLIEIAKRELGMRVRVYPNWVARGKMTPQKADYERAGMACIMGELQKVKQRSAFTSDGLIPEDITPREYAESIREDADRLDITGNTGRFAKVVSDLRKFADAIDRAFGP